MVYLRILLLFFMIAAPKNQNGDDDDENAIKALDSKSGGTLISSFPLYFLIIKMGDVHQWCVFLSFFFSIVVDDRVTGNCACSTLHSLPLPGNNKPTE